MNTLSAPRRNADSARRPIHHRWIRTLSACCAAAVALTVFASSAVARAEAAASAPKDNKISILILGEDPWTGGTTVRWLVSFAEAHQIDLEITHKSSLGVSLADAVAALVQRGSDQPRWNVAVVFETPHRILIQRHESDISADLADLSTLADRIVWASSPVPGDPEPYENERLALAAKLVDDGRLVVAPISAARREAAALGQQGLAADGPSLAGDYLTACVLFETIIDAQPSSLPHETQLDDGTALRVPENTAVDLLRAATKAIDSLRRLGHPVEQYVADLSPPLQLKAEGTAVTTMEEGAIPLLTDWNDDGKRDLVVSARRRGRIDVFLNVGSERQPEFRAHRWMGPDTPQPEAPWKSLGNLGTTIYQVVDVDGDRDRDLLLADSQGSLYLCRNNGTNVFAPPTPLSTGEGTLRVPYLTGAWLGELNEDHNPDIVLGDASGRVFFTTTTTIDGRVVWKAPEPLKIESLELHLPGDAAPVLGDWNGDDKADLLLGCHNGSVLWCRNTSEDGRLRLHPPLTLVAPCTDEYLFSFPVREGSNLWEPVPGWSSYPALGDLNGDGKADLLLGDTNCLITKYRDLTPQEQETIRTLQARRSELEARIAKLSEVPLELKAELLEITLNLVSVAQNRRYTRCGWIWYFARGTH
ncbi:FG-GAP repeat domain-containing protein [Thermostilla marina]